MKVFLLDKVKDSDWPMRRDFIFCNPQIDLVQSLRKLANNTTGYNLWKRRETNGPGLKAVGLTARPNCQSLSPKLRQQREPKMVSLSFPMFTLRLFVRSKHFWKDKSPVNFTLGNWESFLQTLVCKMKRRNYPQGRIALSKKANLTSSHQSSTRTGCSSVAFVLTNGGTMPITAIFGRSIVG